ncbi:MAG: M56 family metallopeptidase [Thermoguttaceae bacterium]
MFNAIFDQCNSFAQTWAWWLGMSILDAAIVLTVVSLLWFAIRRKASPQLGYLLFLLVPLKLFVPLYISVPERFFSWAPKMAAKSPSQDSTVAALPPAAPPRDRTILRLGETTFDMPARKESRTEADDYSVPPSKSSEPSSQFSVDKHASPSLLTWLMFAWLLGILALLARLVHAQVHFHRTILRSTSLADPTRFPVDFGGLLQRMRIGRRIRIVESNRITSPVVWGVFRPTLILPTGMGTSLSNKQLEWVVLHELAHVRRRDLAVNCFQRAAGILHFVNPSIWIANRAIDRLREYACDDMASAYGGISQLESGEAFLGVMRYAASVQHRPETNLEGALGMFESTVRASCFNRMTRLLDSNRRLSVRIRWGSLCLLLLTAALALPQIRAANSQPADENANSSAKAGEKTDEKTEAKAEEKKEDQKLSLAGKDSAEKKETGGNDMKSASHRSTGTVPATPEDQPGVEGVVVDESGRPLEGAQVRVQSAFPLAEGSAITGADGRFRLPLLIDLHITPPLIAQSKDLSHIGFSLPRPMNMALGGGMSKPSEAAPLRIVLKRARTIHVSVKNSDGEPVPGASTEALGNGIPFVGSTTDQQGRATIRLHPEAKILTVIALKDDAGFDYFENYRSWPALEPDPLPETVSLTLTRPHRVRVRTVDSGDKPVPGVFLAPWTLQLPGKLSYVNFSGSSLAGQHSGPSGTCDFSWLPEASPRIGFSEYVKGYHCPDQPSWDGKHPERPVTFRLLKNGDISGSVRFPDGKPAAGIVILGEGRGATNMYFRGSTRTKADGTYTLSIYPNQSTIAAVADHDWAAASHTAIQVGEGETREHLDFALARGTKIRGRVTVGPNQKAASEEMVTLLELGDRLAADARKFGHDRGNLARWAQVDDKGDYEFRVGPGEFTLWLPNTNPNRDMISIKVTDQEELVYNGTAARPARMQIRGRVVNAADGTPVGGATVHGEPIGPSGYARFEARAGSNGEFTLDRVSDTDEYGFYARAPESGLAGFKIVPSAQKEVTVELQPAATVVGYVYKADGQPVEGQKVTAIIGCDREGCISINVNALTGKGGRYRIPALAVGSRCSILVQSEGMSTPSERVKLDKAGEIAARDVVLPGGEGAVAAKAAELVTVKTTSPTTGAGNQSTPPVDLTFTGTVRDETTNKPIPEATVVVRRMILNPSADRYREVLEETKHTTDPAGHYTFTIRKEHSSVQLNEANRRTYLEFDAAHPGFVDRKGLGYSLNMILKNIELGERPFFEDFRLRPGREITAVVAGPDGASLADVPIQSYYYFSDPSEFGGFHEHRTDANGRFRMTIPKRGGAALWIQPRDYAPAEVIIDDEGAGTSGTGEMVRQPSVTEAPAGGDPIIIKGQRGDLGRLTMRSGLTLAGEIVAEDGKPIAHQWVQARRVRDRNQRQKVLSSVGTTIDRYAKSDEQGKVTFGPLPPGEYLVAPCESDNTPLAADRFQRAPIQGVFYALKTTLNSAAERKPFVLKCVPTVRIVAQYYSSDGKKTSGHDAPFYGRRPGGDDFWQTAGRVQEGQIEFLAPRGMEDATLTLVTNEHGSLRYRKSADAPLEAVRELKLGTLEGDLTGIQIIRYVAPILLVKATDASGRSVDAAEVTGQYNDKSLGQPVRFEKQKDSRQRSQQLLPDEKCTITVSAPGHRPESRTISLAEGATSELTLKLEPR